MGSSLSANERIQPRTCKSFSTSMVSILLKHPPHGLALVHGDVGLAQRSGHERAVEQVPGPNPHAPFGDYVELETGGVLVELAYEWS